MSLFAFLSVGQQICLSHPLSHVFVGQSNQHINYQVESTCVWRVCQLGPQTVTHTLVFCELLSLPARYLTHYCLPCCFHLVSRLDCGRPGVQLLVESYQWHDDWLCLLVGWLLACLTFQQHTCVSQAQICSDKFTCCHTEIEVEDFNFLKISHPFQWLGANWSGTGTSHDHLDWPGLSYGEQFNEGDEEEDRGNDGKTTPTSELALNGTSYYGKPRTARSGGSWL